MNKAELEDKLNDLIQYSEEYGIPQGDIPKIIELAEQYAQQVKVELLEDIIPSQKFFHALPPIAKDEYYQFIENQ